MTGLPDALLTDKKRAALLAQRKNGMKPASATSAQVSCKHCGQALADTGSDWKDTASVQETPMQTLGGPYSSGEEVVLRSFGCPCCGILLDTETAMRGDPFLHDRVF